MTTPPAWTTADMPDQTGRTVVVTGGNSGLGFETCKAFAERGATVVLASRDEERGRAAAARLPGRVDVLRLDLADLDSVRVFAAELVGRGAPVDVLVNNAGIGTAVPATRETPEEFRAVVDVNLHGSYWAAQACARVMEPGSSIVNISSILGLTTAGLPQAAYSASKAAIVGLTRDLAQQWGSRKGIRVNAIAPGFFKSEMTDQYKPDYLDSLKSRMVIPRMGDPAELAASLVWLASPAAGYVTGQTIAVDGGVTIT